MVADKFVAVKVAVVLAIVVTAEAKVLEVEDSQRVIAPVCPLKVKVVELVPVQTAAPPATVPPTVAGLIVTATAVLVLSQVPTVCDA